MKKILDITYRVLLIIILFVFSISSVNMIFHQQNLFGSINITTIIIGMFLFILFLITIYNLIRSNVDKLTLKKEITILAFFFFVFILIQLYCAKLLRVTPSWDFGAVYDKAVFFANTGHFTEMDYFRLFPNNTFLLLILSFVFRTAALLNISDYYLIGIILNAISVSISVLFLYLIVRKKFNREMAFISLIIASLVSALFLYIPIFYSDTLSMPYIVIFIYLFECMDVESWSKIKKALYYLTLALVCYVGLKIKITVFIVIVSISIYSILKRKKIMSLVVITLIIILMNYSFETFVSNRLYKNTNVYKIPYTHWIMMGMNSKTMGIYSDTDYNITLKEKTEEEMVRVNIAEIKSRLSAFKVTGYAKFLLSKSNITWGDGTYFAPEKLRRKIVDYSEIHNYVLAGSKHFDVYLTICQVIHFTIMLFIPISAFVLFRKKDKDFSFIPLLSLLGLFLFLLVWETRSRYLINFIPLIILSSLTGLQFIFDKILNGKLLRRKENE